MARPDGGAGEGAGSERDSSRAGDCRRPSARRDGDEPHEGCLGRACECVQADLAAAEKGRHYYSERYAATSLQLREAIDLLRDAHDRDRIDGSMPSIGWYKRVDAYLNPRPRVER